MTLVLRPLAAHNIRRFSLGPLPSASNREITVARSKHQRDAKATDNAPHTYIGFTGLLRLLLRYSFTTVCSCSNTTMSASTSVAMGALLYDGMCTIQHDEKQQQPRTRGLEVVTLETNVHRLDETWTNHRKEGVARCGLV